MGDGPATPVRPVVLVLPLPPNANHYRGVTCNGGHVSFYLTPEARAYKQQAFGIVRSQGFGPPLDGPVAVTLVVFARDRRTDLEGYEKVLWDALQSVCYDNDRQITAKTARLRYDRDHPRVEVTVTPDADYLPPTTQRRSARGRLGKQRPAVDRDTREPPPPDQGGRGVIPAPPALLFAPPSVVQRARALYRTIRGTNRE